MYGSIEQYEEYSVSIGNCCDVSKASIDRSSTTSCSTAISDEGTSLVMDLPIDEQQEQHQEQQKPASLSTLLFQLLGFPSNPLFHSSSSPTSSTRNSSAADRRLAMLSQFSTAYNILSISLPLQLLESSKVSKSLCSSALIAGMIVGQCGGGTLGDMVGRHVAMTVCMGLQVVGAIGSATSAEVPLLGLDLYTLLAAWRFVLGLGCGGVYPLAATMTAESSSLFAMKQSPKMVALTFSMQGVGYLVVPGVAWGLVQCGLPPAVVWRILLGLGSVPGIVLTIGRLSQQRLFHGTKQQQQKQQLFQTHTTMRITANEEMIGTCRPGTPRKAPVSVLDAIRMENNLLIKLLGTAGCWFLFDIMFYANTLFQPMVLSSAFGSTETVSSTARDSTLIALMALPGYIVSIATVGRQSPRYIQLQGFFLMAVLYAIMALSVHDAPRWLVLLLYGATFFYSNYGPNTTTFLLPSLTFSQPCRSTLNGVCAACGKLGALMGTMVFGAVSDGTVVLLWCAGLSLVGWCMTYTCVVVDSSEEEDQDEVQELEERVPMKVVVSRASFLDWHE